MENKEIKNLSLSEIIKKTKKLTEEKESNESRLYTSLSAIILPTFGFLVGNYINVMKVVVLLCNVFTCAYIFDLYQERKEKNLKETNECNNALEAFSRSFATKGYDVSKQELLDARIVSNKKDNTCQRIYVKKEDSLPIVIVEHKKDKLNEILEDSYKMYEYKINEDVMDIKYVDDLMQKEFDSVKKIQK